MLMRAARLRGAVYRICRAHGQRVLVNMIAMNMVEMTVVQIIDMAIMANRRMAAVGTMSVSMIRMVLLVARGHGVCSFHYFSEACSKAF
jgi:hypothetical protein